MHGPTLWLLVAGGGASVLHHVLAIIALDNHATHQIRVVVALIVDALVIVIGVIFTFIVI